MKKTTILELEEKSWYRFLKVVYFGAYVFVSGLLLLFTSITSSYDNNSYYSGNSNSWVGVLFWGAIIIFLFFEVIKRSFFYIVLGKINPPSGKNKLQMGQKFISTLRDLAQSIRKKEITQKWLRRIYVSAFVLCSIVAISVFYWFATHKEIPKCDTTNGWQGVYGECHCNIFYDLDSNTNKCTLQRIQPPETLLKNNTAQETELNLKEKCAQYVDSAKKRLIELAAIDSSEHYRYIGTFYSNTLNTCINVFRINDIELGATWYHGYYEDALAGQQKGLFNQSDVEKDVITEEMKYFGFIGYEPSYL